MTRPEEGSHIHRVYQGEPEKTKKKKRKHRDEPLEVEVSRHESKKAKKKRKMEAVAVEQALANIPSNEHNLSMDLNEFLHFPSELDPQHGSATSFLSAIVAAATGTQVPDALDPIQHHNPYGNAALPSQLDFGHPDAGTSESVIRALQELDLTKIENVLKALAENQTNVAPPPPPYIPPAPASQPSPLGQVPVSSNAILGNDESTLQHPQFTRQDHVHLLATKWLDTKKLHQLVQTEGLVYKKGKFSTSEIKQLKDAIESYRLSRQLSESQMEGIIFPKHDGEKDNAFWSDITMAVPQRPIIAVYHYVRRAYNPLKQQGKWTPEEDQKLKIAVANCGQQWEKVSASVGRRSADCRDRFRNHIVNSDKRNTGHWSKEEEEELTRIVTQMTIDQGKDCDNDVFWSKVSQMMGGKRARQQCRIKWTDSLSKLLKNDGEKARWGSQDAYILVHKIDSLHVRDDSEIDWKTLSDSNWRLWSAHILQRRWLTMKRSIKGYEDMKHQEIVDILKEKKTSAPPPPGGAVPNKRKPRKFTSAEDVKDGDSDDNAGSTS